MTASVIAVPLRLTIAPLTSSDIERSFRAVMKTVQMKRKKSFRAETERKAERDFKTLEKLLKVRASGKWQIGDLVFRLVEVHGRKLTEIGQRVGYRKSFISKLYSTSKAFPLAARRADIPWFVHQMVRESANRVAKEVEAFTEKPQAPDYADALTAVLNGLDKNGRPIREPRAATKFLIERARAKFVPPTAEGILAKLRSGDFINNCHHCDCRELLPRFEPKSVKVFNLDPIYAQYRKLENEKLHTATSVALTSADNELPEQITPIICDVLRAAPPLLKDGGVILLWQASTMMLRMPVIQAIEEAGLEVFSIVTWDKGRPQPGNFASAYTTQTELIYVIVPKGSTPLNHDNGCARSNIIAHSPVPQKCASLEQKHIFQKPEGLMEFLIRKHSSEGELVADLFGCSGSCCIAAHTHGRNWVYSESNAENFAFGSRRILEATAEVEKASA